MQRHDIDRASSDLRSPKILRAMPEISGAAPLNSYGSHLARPRASPMDKQSLDAIVQIVDWGRGRVGRWPCEFGRYAIN